MQVSLEEALPSQLSVDIPTQLCTKIHVDELFYGYIRCMLKECLDVLVDPITRIINSSILTGKVPSTLKTARVTPVIKNPTLDPEVFKNYRPISNTPFLIKTIERVIAQQIHSHLMANNLYSEFQSAYRKKPFY